MPEQKTGLQFDFEWRLSLVTALLLPSLVFLGLWQLQRAEEKSEIGRRWEQQRQQPPTDISVVDWSRAEQLAYQPVSLRGSFSEGRHFLLDNRISNGRFGYEVLSVFELVDNNTSVLVNRGWIAGDPGRQILPGVPPVVGEIEITGHIYVAPGAPYLLAEQVFEPGWPKRIQAVEMDKLLDAAQLPPGQAALPYPIRIDDGVSGALAVDWQVVNVSPDKHRGYSVQWFTMAAVLAIFFILRSSNLWQVLTRKIARKTENRV